MTSRDILMAGAAGTTPTAYFVAPPAHEQLVPLSIALADLPIPPPSTATGIRWVTQGCRGRRLEGTRIANRWYTTAAAVRRFAGVED